MIVLSSLLVFFFFDVSTAEENTCGNNHTGMAAKCHSLLATQRILSRTTTATLAKVTANEGIFDCEPDSSYSTYDDACEACHDCRGSNKCPCSFFVEAGTFHFCYDSNAPDMDPTSMDAHNTAMHCDTLAPASSAISTCAKNAVQTADSDAMVQIKKKGRSHPIPSSYCPTPKDTVESIYQVICQV